jgi:hypothetical protein
MTDWTALREAVLARCQNYCELCGNALTDTFALHHRKLKSRGGKDTIDNLVALHHACHNMGNNAVHLNVQKATVSGHMVPTYATPSEYPLHLPNGSIVTLSAEGTYIYLEKAEKNGW